MKKEKIWNFIKNPPKWLIFLIFCLAIIFCVITIVFLVLNVVEEIYAYIIFGIAGILLTYSVFLIVVYSPKIKQFFINILKKFKFTRKMYENYKFRTVMFSFSSLVMNFTFGTFEIVMGIIGRSIWFSSLGLYHLILSFTRFGIIYRYHQHNKKQKVDLIQELRTYQNTGICILAFNIALAGAMLEMILSRRSFEYAGLMIYTVAVYTFYKIIISTVGILKAKKYNDFNIQSLRNLNLTDALVSIYGLQTAFIATFNENGSNITYMNIATGIVVILLSIIIGIFMIIKSQKEKQKLQNNK